MGIWQRCFKATETMWGKQNTAALLFGGGGGEVQGLICCRATSQSGITIPQPQWKAHKSISKGSLLEAPQHCVTHNSTPEF